MDRGHKHTYVGQFFEAVGHRIFGGDLSRNEDGDICLWRTSTSVEVKASGSQSSYGFRLSVEQIEHYEQISTFPFDRVWYVLFAYRNRSLKNKEKGRRSTELSFHETPLTINSYLASSALWCMVVDISIVNRWKETLPHSTKSIMGHLGARTVDLKCRNVHTFVNGGLDSGLKELGLDPEKFGRVSGNIKTTVQPDLFNVYEINLPLTAVLPLSEISSFQRMLKRRGFSLIKRTK